MNDRIQTLRNKMAGAQIQGMIITNPVNVKYLTGIEAEGTFLITRKENIYITDGRYIEYVNSVITPFDEIIIDNYKNISKDEYENFFMFCENVGFEENYVTYYKYKEYMYKYKINNFVEADSIISNIRSIKDEKEIQNITKACHITDKCFEFLLSYIKVGMSEKQIAKKIEEFFEENADGLAFDTIVASGENSSKPHAVPSDRKIQERDIITIDMGCIVNGYCSDMTRTIFVGNPTEEQKKVYHIVLKNQKNVIERLNDGANLKPIIQDVIGDFKLSGFDLIHGLGHGVGMEIHKKPVFSTTNDYYIKENMIITDEPGIYILGDFGIRIEDTILITKDKPVVLTESSKECIII